MTENEKYLYDHFLISIKSGFESLEDIIEGALEVVEDEGWQREISEEWIREILTREYEKNEEASETWEVNTDSNKLAKAFDLLCKRKILALHNIGYTLSEAVYDCQEVWKDLEDVGIHPTGYCYYHGQDLERVVETKELLIGFSGIMESNEKEAIAIGNKVVLALQNVGFIVEWNNTATERIKVVNFDWKNVYTSEEEIEKKWGHDRVFQLMKN